MIARLWITTALLLATAGYLVSAQQPEIALKASLSTVPMRISEWRGVTDPPFTRDILDVLGVDEYVARTYVTRSDLFVNLYVGFYKSQRQGDTIHSPLNCLPGAGWLPVEQARTTVNVSDHTGAARAITVNQFVIQKGLEKQLVLYWYQSRGRVVASEYTSKVYMVADAIRLNRTDAALVRVVTPIASDNTSDRVSAIGRAQHFVQGVFPELTRVLPS
jgi:EpsI family protein